MKICLVNLDFAPFRSSGLAVYGERLARGLAARGQQVTVVASLRDGLPAHGAQGEIEVYRAPLGRSNWIGYAWHAGRLATRLHAAQRFDVIHFLDGHFAYAYRGRYVASLFQSFRQRATGDRSLPYHSSTANLLGRFVYYHLARLPEAYSVRRAEALIAASRAAAAEFVQYYGLAPEKVTVVPLGIDIDFFRPQPEPSGLRRALGLADDEQILLYVGFSTPRKGVDTLVQALPHLDPGVRLLIAGQWEAGYRAKVRRALAGHSERVIELGYVADGDLPGLYALADVFVFPSLLEGFGLPPAEALACGRPVVASAVGSLPEVVGDAGRLVPPQDPKALAAALEALLADEALRRELGERGRRRAVREFNEEQMVDRTLDVYRAVV